MANQIDREEIYRIRHKVYACELGQHPKTATARLTDALDCTNTYIAAKIFGKLAGFISITPPKAQKYSIDKYFAREALPCNVDQELHEIRLLTVLPAYRGSEIATLLMYAGFRWIESHGGQQIVAIGRREILQLYLKLGLTPLGMSTRCGLVTYDLLHASVWEVRASLSKFDRLLARIASNTDWALDFPFHKPAACFHGGAFFRAIGERFDSLERKEAVINADVLDAWFSPSPRVVALLKKDLEWLMKTSPPTGCEGLIQNIAQARALKPINILPGAGSSDLIFRALPHWLSCKSKVLILDPMYGEYAHILERVIGATVDRLPLSRSDNYKLNLDQLKNALRQKYDLVVLVNPNSPTGQHTPRPLLERVLCSISTRTRVWVDETYVEYAGRNESLERFAAESENIIVCKSMSKAYALSGLRVGYLCAGANQLEALRALTPPWVVSLPAQLAASIALQERDYYAARYAETTRLRAQLREQLSSLNWEVIEGKANLLLCELPAVGPSAEQLVERCREQGLFLRNARWMGSRLGSHTIRVAVKDVQTNAKIVAIIEKALQTFNDNKQAKTADLTLPVVH